jgi:asparagine synthase (glutamine-hydrolysing)
MFKHSKPFLHIRTEKEQIGIRGTIRYAKQDSTRPRGQTGLRWSWESGVLSVKNDFFGIEPLYYAATSASICVSPFISSILACGIPADPNDGAISVFLRLGFYIGEDTPFCNIRALPPNAELIWKPGSATEIRTRSTFPSGPVIRNREYAMKEYASRFHDAVRAMPGAAEDVVLPLSGGKDSRHILFELMRCGRKPSRCITTNQYQVGDFGDVPAATELAKTFDIPHDIVSPPVDRLGAELRKNVETGFCADEHAWLLAVADAMPNKGIVFDGIGGDVLSAGLFLVPDHLQLYRNGNLRQLAAELFEHWHGTEDVVQQATSSLAYERFDPEIALDRLVDVLDRYTDWPNPLSAFYLWNRTRREIALYTKQLLGVQTAVWCPYLDESVFELLARLDPSVVADKNLHRDVIAESFPEYAHLPYAAFKAGNGGTAARNWAFQALKHFASASSLVNIEYLLPRFAKAILTGHDIGWLRPERLLCIAQAESHAGEVDVAEFEWVTEESVTPGLRVAYATA